MSDQTECIKTNIWSEQPEDSNPFAARQCLCSGYDVYGDLLGKISWVAYIYLLFKLELPSKDQEFILENVAIALANPGPRDPGVRAAMNGGVGGSTAASCLIAAIGVGAGKYQGAREIFDFMKILSISNLDTKPGQGRFNTEMEQPLEVWPESGHSPGSDPYGTSCATPVIQTLELLCKSRSSRTLKWLRDNRDALEAQLEAPISLVAVIGCAFHDLQLTPDQAEMIYMMLRLPGAAAHSLEQKAYGWRNYPFFKDAVKLVPETLDASTE